MKGAKTLWLNKEYTNMSLFNVDTGEKIGDIGDLAEVQFDVNTKYETKYDAESHKFNALLTASDFEMTVNINTSINDIYKVLGIDSVAKPDAYDINFVKFIQCRTHKRKRINKKFAKLYGYKPITVTSKRWQLNTYTDGTFEFKKEITE